MTNNNPLNARRMIVVSALALLAIAVSAAAIPQLGLAHSVDTPAGSLSAQASDKGVNTCIGTAVPQLPALPAVPSLPVPVAVPAIPSAYGSAKVCAEAGLDGVYADANADAMGAKAGTSADVDTSQQHETAKGVVAEAKGIFETLKSRITGLF